VIPDSVTEIGDRAFSDCSALKKLTLGSGVKSLGESTFYGVSLDELHVDKIETWLNITFTDSDDNPIEDVDGFYVGGELLTELVIPEGINSISAYAFYKYEGITSVIFSDSIVLIDKSAFYKVEPENVYFTGYAEEWSFIDIHGGNDGITDATVYCEYSE